MGRVIISLLPLLLFSVFLFGFRSLLLLVVVCVTGLITEYAAMRLVQGPAAKVTESVLVSCFLFTLTLPPSTPYWVAAVGIAFGLFFGKGVFGGFGRNVFNPALVGRCFVYISFPAHLTLRWTTPFTRWPGGLIRYDQGLDAITRATPLVSGGPSADWSVLDHLIGFRSGSLGETSVILIALAAAYLLATRSASWIIMSTTLGGFLATSAVLSLSGASSANPLFSLMTGGILFAAVFMATDPVTAPAQLESKILYGLLIGLLTAVIRSFSLFAEGAMFAILIANTFVPLIDRQVRQVKARRKAVAA